MNGSCNCPITGVRLIRAKYIMFEKIVTAMITQQIGARRTIHNRELCFKYNYRPNWTPLSLITIIYHVV